MRDDGCDLLQARLGGLLLGLVHEVEGGASGHQGQDHADGDDRSLAASVFTEFGVHPSPFRDTVFKAARPPLANEYNCHTPESRATGFPRT